MNPIKWLFKVLKFFGLMDSEDFSRNRAEAIDWYDGIRIDEEHYKKVLANEPGTKKTDLLLIKVKRFFQTWYAQTALAVLFIFAVRWVKEYMDGWKKSDSDDDEDDFEDKL